MTPTGSALVLRLIVFFIPLEVQGHIVPHWKAPRYGKDELLGLSYDSTLSIFQDVLKSGNFLHKRGWFSYAHCHVYACTSLICMWNEYIFTTNIIVHTYVTYASNLISSCTILLIGLNILHCIGLNKTDSQHMPILLPVVKRNPPKRLEQFS